MLHLLEIFSAYIKTLLLHAGALSYTALSVLTRATFSPSFLIFDLSFHLMLIIFLNMEIAFVYYKGEDEYYSLKPNE